MRAKLAMWLVHLVGACIDHAYSNNCWGRPRREHLWAELAKPVQYVAFPLARRLDKEAMVDQMIAEGWWG